MFLAMTPNIANARPSGYSDYVSGYITTFSLKTYQNMSWKMEWLSIAPAYFLLWDFSLKTCTVDRVSQQLEARPVSKLNVLEDEEDEQSWITDTQLLILVSNNLN